ncbi:MAG: hypothetical protein IPP07_17625 [Holophagales bacterium]|nr:hypothetical protein [Holophagales bacterium]
MRTRSLIGILAVLCVGWLFVLGPALLAYARILRNADGYRPAELVVTGQNCIGGTRDSKGRSSPRFCFLEGKVVEGEGPGIEEEMSVGSELPADRPVGTRVAVHYNPALPPFGMNYFNLRVLPREDVGPATMARRRLLRATRIIQLSLGLALLVHLLLRWGRRRFTRESPDFSVDLGGGHPVGGTLLLSQGLVFLLGQGRSPAVAGIILGLLLVLAGGPLLLRRYAVFSRDLGAVTRGRQFLGVSLGSTPSPWPEPRNVVLGVDAGRLTISIFGSDSTEVIPGRETYARSRDLAARLAGYFRVDLEDRAEAHQELLRQADWLSAPQIVRALGRWGVVLGGVVLILGGAALAVDRVPSLRMPVVKEILDPSGRLRHTASLRGWALSRLERDPSDEALLELMKVLNTVDAGSFPDVAEDVAAAALRKSGLPPQEGEGRDGRILRINAWAAARLGRPLDDGGGLLGWFPVDPRFAFEVEKIAGTDLREAWSTWSFIGAGQLTTPEQFLFALGAALGDRRPVHFAIRKGSFFQIPGSELPFEGQPEPIEEHPEAIVRTVGDAIAIRLWTMQGVGDEKFPEDFLAWWREWARARRIPVAGPAMAPPGDGAAPSSGGASGAIR